MASRMGEIALGALEKRRIHRGECSSATLGGDLGDPVRIVEPMKTKAGRICHKRTKQHRGCLCRVRLISPLAIVLSPLLPNRHGHARYNHLPVLGAADLGPDLHRELLHQPFASPRGIDV